ncbi:hypothetical protein ACU8KH_03313 [Lachancea thermotolerans]
MSPDFFCLELDLPPILQPVYKLYIWVDVFFILESFFIINLRPFTSTLVVRRVKNDFYIEAEWHSAEKPDNQVSPLKNPRRNLKHKSFTSCLTTEMICMGPT